MSSPKSGAEAPRGPAERPCSICGMSYRIRGLATHERACERHQMDDDPDDYALWVIRRRKLWRYRHKGDRQQRLEEVIQ